MSTHGARLPAGSAAGPSVAVDVRADRTPRPVPADRPDPERVEAIATHVFSGGKTVGFEKLITKLGRAQIANARIEQSLAGLTRVFAFVAIDERIDSGEGRQRGSKPARRLERDDGLDRPPDGGQLRRLARQEPHEPP